jgi:hypothetical protein
VEETYGTVIWCVERENMLQFSAKGGGLSNSITRKKSIEFKGISGSKTKVLRKLI